MALTTASARFFPSVASASLALMYPVTRTEVIAAVPRQVCAMNSATDLTLASCVPESAETLSR